MKPWGKDYYFHFKEEPLVESVKYGMTYEEYINMSHPKKQFDKKAFTNE